MVGRGAVLLTTADNTGLGAQLAEKVLTLVPAVAKGSVLIGSTRVGVPPLDMRVQGMIDKIKALRPDLTIVCPVATNGVTATWAEVFTAWDGLLTNNPDAVAVLAPSAQDVTAWGLMGALKGFKLPAGGFDLEAGNLQGSQGWLCSLCDVTRPLVGRLYRHPRAGQYQTKGRTADPGSAAAGRIGKRRKCRCGYKPPAKRRNCGGGLGPSGDGVLADPAAHIVGPWPPG
jgi:hypothetical protein